MKFPYNRHISPKWFLAFLCSSCPFFFFSGKETVLLKDYPLMWLNLTQIFNMMNQLTLFTPLVKEQQKVPFFLLLPRGRSGPSCLWMYPKQLGEVVSGPFYRRGKGLRQARKETWMEWKGKYVFQLRPPRSNFKVGLGRSHFMTWRKAGLPGWRCRSSLPRLQTPEAAWPHSLGRCYWRPSHTCGTLFLQVMHQN